MSTKPSRRTETVTVGTAYAGKINVTERGHEAFDADDKYLATYPTIAEARKVLFKLHQVGAA